jgi:hypothetical protein
MTAKGSLERDIMLGRSCRIQEAGKTTDTLASQNQGNYRPTFGSLKKQYKIGKNGAYWWKKRLGIGNTQI